MGTVRTVGAVAMLAFGLLAPGAGCHGTDPWGTDGGPVDATDGPPQTGCDGGILFCSPPPTACDPVAPPGQQGCFTGERCIWRIVQEEPEHLGTFACVPDGTLGLGDACTEATVFADDQCRAGLVCVGDTCHDVCGFDGSASAACAPSFNCARIEGLYANGEDDPAAGVCTPGCEPVSQTQPGGAPCPAGEGCYVLSSATTTIAVCAVAGTVGHGEVISGPAFANSCVPGAQPRRRDETTMQVECGGLCRPADVTSTTHVADEGGIAPEDCQVRWGAAPPGDPTAGESCRYWWAREPFDTPSPYSNTVGWCFKHPAFRYDSDGDTVVDAPFPRCTALTTGDVVPPIGNPPHNDAQFFWCAATPAAPFFSGPRSPAPAPALRLDRLQP